MNSGHPPISRSLHYIVKRVINYDDDDERTIGYEALCCTLSLTMISTSCVGR